MDKDAFDRVLQISEEFFGTQNDPDQMPINKDSANKLHSIHPDTIIYKFDEEGNPIAWVVAVPTSIHTMNLFLERKITEKELLEDATKEKSFEALYLCAVFVLPEYRKKGYARVLLSEALNKIPNAKNAILYTWIYSKEGKSLCGTLSKETNKKILSISSIEE